MRLICENITQYVNEISERKTIKPLKTKLDFSPNLRKHREMVR
jgi:ribosomal protein L28